MNRAETITAPRTSRTMLGTISVADVERCRELTERVFSLRDAWIPRAHCGQHGGFATLGCATYLDVCSSDRPQRDYYDRCRGQNELLRSNFGDLLERVFAKLSEAIQAEIYVSEELALPGFHVFWGTSLVDVPTPSLCHFDTQFQSIRWHGRWGNSSPKSFTVPICLPVGGSSLDLWPITYRELLEGSSSRGTSLLEYVVSQQHHCQTHWYELGICTIQNDLWLHRIGKSGTQAPMDYRITLQGHLLEVEGQWIAYW